MICLTLFSLNTLAHICNIYLTFLYAQVDILLQVTQAFWGHGCTRKGTDV